MEYTEAKRIGRKTLRDAMTKKEYPYVRALDELLENQETAGSSRVGVVEIPLSLVVGTRTRGRAESFARDFMPILSEQSEFAMKWEQLYNAQIGREMPAAYGDRLKDLFAQLFADLLQL